MAEVNETLRLRDRFSATFGKYLQQAKRASKATQEFTNMIHRVAGAVVSVRGAQQLLNMADAVSQTTARLNRMNDGLQTTAELNEMIYRSAQRSRGAYQDTADMVAKLGTLAGDAFNSTAETVAFAEQLNKQIALSGASTQGAQAAMLQLTQAMSSGTLRGEELNSILEQTPTIAHAIADYMGVTIGEMRTLASEGQVTADVVKNALFAAADETNAAFESMPKTWGQIWTGMKNDALMAFQPVLQKISELANSPEMQAFQQNASEAMYKIADTAMQAIDAIGQVAVFVQQNWGTIAPLVTGAAVAFVAYKGAVLLAAAAQGVLNSTLLASPIFWIAATIGGVVAIVMAFHEALTPLAPAIMAVSAAVLILNAALWANPILMVVGLIGLLVGAILMLMQRFSSLQILWLTVCNALQYAWNTFVIWFMTGVYAVQNFLDEMSLAFSNAGAAVANFMGDMQVKVLSILQNMINGAISIINSFIAALNNLPGVEIQAISGVTFATEAALSNQAGKMMRAAQMAAKTAGVIQNRTERAGNIAGMTQQRNTTNLANKLNIAAIQGQTKGTSMGQAVQQLAQEIGGAGGNIAPYIGGGAGGGAGGSGGGGGGKLGSDVAAIRKEVTMGDEELKSLVDLAERRYVNNINLTAQTPVINITGQNTGNTAADRRTLANTIRDMLVEQQAAASLRSTAMVK